MRPRFSLIAAVIACFAAMPGVARPADPASTPTWEQVASTNSEALVTRHESGFVGFGQELVLLGGRGRQPVSRFHLVTGRWTSGARPPVELHHFQAAISGSSVFVAGAFAGNYPGETAVPFVHVYDMADDQWGDAIKVPGDRVRGSAAAVFHNETLYLFGGIRDGHRGGHVPWLDTYNTKTGRWQSLTDAPRSRDHHAIVVCNDRLYAVGGPQRPDLVMAAWSRRLTCSTSRQIAGQRCLTRCRRLALEWPLSWWTRTSS